MRRGVASDDLQHALASIRCRRQIEHRAAVVLDAKCALRHRQRVRRNDRHDRAELRVRAAQELASRGHVLEQLAHDDRRAAIARPGPQLAAAGVRIAIDLGRVGRRSIGSRQREMRDARDGRQRFAAEAEGADAGEVVEDSDFGGGVSLDCEERVFA